MQEFIDLARAKPKSINYGSAGVGGINHLGTELLTLAARARVTDGGGTRSARPGS